MSMSIEQTAPLLRRARAALEAMRPEEVFAKNAEFPVAQSLDRFDAGAPLAERFPSPEALFAALRAEDPTVMVFALQLLAAMDRAAAESLALEVLRAWGEGGSALDLRARRSAAMVLGERVSALPLDELVAWVLAGRLSVPQGLSAHPDLARPEAQRALLRRLDEEPYDAAASATQLRNTLLQQLVVSRDPETLQWLFTKWQDEGHPFSSDAAQWLLRSGDEPTLRRMAAMADQAFSGGVSDTRRFHLVRAILESGDSERLHALVLPRFLGEAATADAASQKVAQEVLSQLTQAVRSGRLPRDDQRLAAAIVPLLAVGAFKGLAKALLTSMDQAVVKAASSGPLKPAAKPARAGKATATAPAAPSAQGYLARYEAGETRAVWEELRALGATARTPAIEAECRAVVAATMQRFGENVERIVAVLKKAKYPFASKNPFPPARPDAAKKLAAIAKLIGPLPLSLEVFYSRYDGVDLAQNTEAVIPATKVLGPGVLDELGRSDPLIVVSLAALEADAKAIVKRNKALADALREPLYPYLSPDPRCKGMGDDVADDKPVRLVPGEGADGELASSGADPFFVDWLRRYVQAGGFLSLASPRDRAVLGAGLVAF
ncbi:MAG: hypothetical protein ABI193_20295 [Minicystis sp.]